MENTFIDNFSSILFADLNDHRGWLKENPLLAHYTSVPVLEQIMKSNEIWMSNPLFMNDLHELRFGLLQGRHCFINSKELENACETNEIYHRLINTFEQQFEDFHTNHALDTYVMCLTEHKTLDNHGSLSMWRGYGAVGGGAAIIFDSSTLDMEDTSATLIIDKVKYETNESRIEWIKSKILALADFLQQQPQSNEHIEVLVKLWLLRLKIFSLLTKHNGFEEENEWRVIYMSELDQEQKFHPMFSYAITSRGVEPKLKLKIIPNTGVLEDDISLDKLVNKIILGPTNSSTLHENSIKKMLNLIGKNSIALKVISSDIPFRA